MNGRGTFLTREFAAAKNLWRYRELVASLVSRNLGVASRACTMPVQR